MPIAYVILQMNTPALLIYSFSGLSTTINRPYVPWKIDLISYSPNAFWNISDALDYSMNNWHKPWYISSFLVTFYTLLLKESLHICQTVEEVAHETRGVCTMGRLFGWDMEEDAGVTRQHIRDAVALVRHWSETTSRTNLEKSPQSLNTGISINDITS